MNKSPNHILYRSCFRSGSTFGPPPAQLVTASPCDRHSNVEKGGVRGMCWANLIQFSPHSRLQPMFRLRQFRRAATQQAGNLSSATK